MLEQKFIVRVSMLYDFKQGKSAAESLQTLHSSFGEDCISRSQCFKWFKRFHDGDESLEDHDHKRRPQSLDEGVLKDAIEADPTLTLRELAAKFGCSYTTIETHLQAIGKKNRCGKWVPHLLTDAMKASRVSVASSLLAQTKNSGFLDSIVTADEKWI